MDQEMCLLLYHLTKKETPGTTQGNSQIIKGIGLLHEVICNGNHSNLHEVIHSLVVFREKDTRNALFIFSIYSFIAIGFDRYLFTLDCNTTLSRCTMIYSQKHNVVMIFLNLGGLGFPLHNNGISLTVVGIMLLPLSFFLFPLVSQ